jgi:hypothetical protein
MKRSHPSSSSSNSSSSSSFSASISSHENLNTTSLAHRNALFYIPRSLISEAINENAWRHVAALTRINILSICKGAQHGWLGASFSCLDILLAMHLRMKNVIDFVILSKGHAAAAQYAVLFNSGDLNEDQLKNYKRGRSGDLEAHADIMCDTGSLGQCLSTVAGMASISPKKHFGIVLGDGELQEVQNYEGKNMFIFSLYFISCSQYFYSPQSYWHTYLH